MQLFIKKFNYFFVLIYFAIYLQPDAFALRVNAEDYQYPYKNPYLATTTVSIMKGRNDLLADDAVHRRNLDIKVFDDRDEIYLLEKKGKLRFRFYQQNNQAPLIFIIPGFGGSSYAGSSNYIAELLVDQGFHVIVLPSPFNWNFALAASSSGFPGLTKEDSEDLYSAMQLILSYTKEQHNAEFGKIGLLGLSNGALNAAYISNIDSKQRKIGINTYLLVNPPVDLLGAIKEIDQVIDLATKFGSEQIKRINAYASGVVGNALKNEFNDPDYFANWDKRFCLTDEQIKYLIGHELQSSIGDVIYVIELVHNLNILRTSISYRRRSLRMGEAHSHSLMDYVEVFLIPWLKQKDAQASINILNMQTLLKSVERTLVENKNIFLMHNQDDFLASSEDLDYLERIFGDRAKIYPYGGHMGNLWYWQNKKDIVSIFKRLLKN